MKDLSRNKGFSLVELIIVVAIITVLAAAITPALIRYIEKSRESIDIDNCDEVFRAMSNELLSDKVVFDKSDPTAEFRITVNSNGLVVSTRGVTDPAKHTEAVFKSLGIEADSSNQFVSNGLKSKSKRVSENQSGTITRSYSVVLNSTGGMTKNIYFID
ncbi:MAG: prepilin-type N-terminal cleavage/methylation domain-containing protein [Eubacterium sp.]|nr:prepilin-type N-terminal cleavage/methylation domain-containing protein [Eubacterium sp.]